jgi:hypothetical protein
LPLTVWCRRAVAVVYVMAISELTAPWCWCCTTTISIWPQGSSAALLASNQLL